MPRLASPKLHLSRSVPARSLPARSMIYSLTLGPAFLLTGAVLIVLAAIVLARPRAAGKWLQRFPRSRAWGLGLLLGTAAWAWYLIYTIDLGEFDKWRRMV